jgi:large subunit ribosomal protein L3
MSKLNNKVGDMIRGLIGKKIGMTQIFNREGNVVPVTVVEVGPCTVLELKETPMKVKVGFEAIAEKKLNKAESGFFKKIGISPFKFVTEFYSTDNKDYKIGQEIKADLFKVGDFVDVSGVTIGKGFQGGMKRWGWSGGPATHGSMHHRRVGSIGSSADPSRVLPGRNMPGHMGAANRTAQGLRVVRVDLDNNLLLLKGAVPGHSNSTVYVNLSRKKKFKVWDEEKVVVAKKVNPMKQSKAKAGAKK